MSDHASTLQPGDLVLGRYQIESHLGHGGMGSVYVARQTSLDRRVALKVLHPRVASSPTNVARFRREAEALSKLLHANTVQLIDFDVDDRTGQPFIVSELIDGRTLTDVIRAEGPMSEARAATLVAQVARALSAAHALGIVHRDLKPGNIMLARLDGLGPELVKVLDFGLARSLADEGDTLRLTVPGSFLGTPEFASPEQSLGEPADERSDLYSLGCVLYACLAGRPPYLADSAGEIGRMHVQAPIPELPDRSPSGSAIGGEVRRVCRALLSKRASERPASAALVAEMLAGIAIAGGLDAETQPDDASTHPEAPSPLVLAVDASTDGASREETQAVMTTGITTAPAFTSPALTATAAAATPPRRPGLAIYAAAAALVGIAAALLVLRAGVDPRAVHPASAGGEAPDPRAPRARDPLDRGGRTAGEAGAAAPPARAAPSRETPVSAARVEVVSAPSGAEVLERGRSLGVTPLVIELAGSSRELVLRRNGHQDSTLTIAAGGPRRVEVALVPLGRRPARRSPDAGLEVDGYKVW